MNEQQTHDELVAVWNAMHELQENVGHLARLLGAQMGTDVNLPHLMSQGLLKGISAAS